MRSLLAVAVAALLAASGCGGGSDPAPSFPGRSDVPASTRSHVVTIVMENHELGRVIGSPDAPYANRLARRYGLATQSFGMRHPSLPNYLALTSGSTHGITSDCTGCHVGGRNLVDQLETAHVSWRAYLEGLPRPCFTGASSGRYAKKHDPFAYYDDVVSNPSRCGRIVPFDRLAGDLRTHRLPTYAYIAPDLCHDTHDCPTATGDAFLRRVVPGLLRGIGPHGFVVITYDEGDSDAGCCGGAKGGRIATIVAGPGVRRGARDSHPVDQVGVLRTVEAALGLPALGGARHGDLSRLFAHPPRLP
jgi:phosphatidylinositol-3-phosphatase